MANDELKKDPIVAMSEICGEEVIAIAHIEGEEENHPDPANLPMMQRRMLVRSIFAYIEALTYAIKQSSLGTSRRSPTAGELSMVEETAFELNDNGSLTTTRNKVRLFPNIRFAFNFYASLAGYTFSLDCSGKGWQNLTASAKVRDRLMHPKSVVDLEVSAEEIRSALDAFFWFQHQIIALLAAHNSHLRNKLANRPAKQAP